MSARIGARTIRRLTAPGTGGRGLRPWRISLRGSGRIYAEGDEFWVKSCDSHQARRLFSLPHEALRSLMRLLLPFALLLASSSVIAQTPPPVPQQPLTLERIFGNPPLSGPTPRLLRLSPDGRSPPRSVTAPTKGTASISGRSTPRPARRGCWSIQQAFGTGAALSEDERMQRERARIAGLKGIVAYDWSPDGKSSSCRWTAISISPGSTARSAGSPTRRDRARRPGLAQRPLRLLRPRPQSLRASAPTAPASAALTEDGGGTSAGARPSSSRRRK